MTAVDETFQNAPSWSDLQQHEPDEFGDRRDWLKSVSDDVGSFVINYQHPSPYDERPGSLASVNPKTRA